MKWIAANWKMHGTHAKIQGFLEAFCEKEYQNVQIIFLPPFIFLPSCYPFIKDNFKLGAQNVASAIEGAYTGEISAGMLQETGCQYGLVGHSERRSLFSEKNAIIEKKIKVLCQVGLIPILCVGETYKQKQAQETHTVLKKQLKVLREAAGRIIIAYEPVWAIGTGLTPSLEEIQQIHRFIKHYVSISYPAVIDLQLLYGGSLKAQNAQAILNIPEVDGGLIGRASLDIHEFMYICDRIED